MVTTLSTLNWVSGTTVSNEMIQFNRIQSTLKLLRNKEYIQEILIHFNGLLTCCNMNFTEMFDKEHKLYHHECRISPEIAMSQFDKKYC